VLSLADGEAPLVWPSGENDGEDAHGSRGSPCRGLIDLGIYRLLVYLPPSSLSRPLRVLYGLPMLAALWIGVPVGEYYACSSRASDSTGYLAAFSFFIAGFIVVVIFGQRDEYRRGLRKLDEEDQQVTGPADGSP
jgi:hypothetical protein